MNKICRGNGPIRRKKPQQRSSVGTAVETVALDRTTPAVAKATVARKVRRRVTTKIDGSSGRVIRAGVSETMSTGNMSCAQRPFAVSKSAFRGNHSQRYGCIKYPWWSDDNVQTYMEIMNAREAQEKLRLRMKKPKTIARTSEKHDLSVQFKNRPTRLKLSSKRKTKIAPIQKTCSFDTERMDRDFRPTRQPAPHYPPTRIVRTVNTINTARNP